METRHTPSSGNQDVKRISHSADHVHEKGVAKYSVTVNCSVEQVFAFSRDFRNFIPKILKSENIAVISLAPDQCILSQEPDQKNVWVVRKVDEVTDVRISLEATVAPSVTYRGALIFEPDARSRAIVRLEFDDAIFDGKLAMLVSFLKPGEHATPNAAVLLRRFKALVETGEVPTIEGQSSGRLEKNSKKYLH